MSPAPEPTDATANRRPIAARRLPVFHALARALARLGVTPNAISLLGMVGGCLAGAALAMTDRARSPAAGRAWFLAGAAFIQLRLLANLLDGMVAVEGGHGKTPTGELFNEVPDRVSDAATLIGAGFALGSSPTLGYLAALAAVFTAYVRAMGAAVGTGQHFGGLMAKQQRMAVLTGAAVVSVLLPVVWWGGRPVGLLAAALLIILLLSLVTAGQRLWRIAAALRAKARGEGGGR